MSEAEVCTPTKTRTITRNTVYLTPHARERIAEIYGPLSLVDCQGLFEQSREISAADVMLLTDRPDLGEYTWSLETRFFLDPSTWGVFAVQPSFRPIPWVAVTYLRVQPRLRDIWIWMAKFFIPT